MSITSLDAYGASRAVNTAAVKSTAAVSSVAQGNTGNVGSGNQQASAEELKSAVKKLNDFVSPVVQSIEFAIDQDSNRVIVKVLDSETKKVLRQIPNEEVLAISKTLDRLQGLVIRQTA